LIIDKRTSYSLSQRIDAYFLGTQNCRAFASLLPPKSLYGTKFLVSFEVIDVRYGGNSLRGILISLASLENIPISPNQVHHRGTEGTEREIDFFVYREMPIYEKNL
jgi:hypothetical protein